MSQIAALTSNAAAYAAAPPAPAQAAPQAPSHAVAAAPTQSVVEDERRRKMHAAAEGARAGGFQLPMWGQYGLSTVLDHFYQTKINSHVRNTTERILGNEVDKPFKPPTTPGYLGRTLIFSVGMTYLNNGLLAMMLKRSGHGNGGNMMATASGSVGANLAATAGAMTVQAAAKAARGVLARNFVLVGFSCLLDAIWGAKIGSMVESGINGMLGVKKTATQTTELASNVPMSTVKQTPEQTARAFGRGFLATTSYTLIWQMVGSIAARSVFTAIGGPVGAIAGAFAGTLATTMINHVVMWANAPYATKLAQQGARLVLTALGKPLDKKTPNDVAPKIGDRMSIAVEGALLPFAVALLSGNMRTYMKSIG